MTVKKIAEFESYEYPMNKKEAQGNIERAVEISGSPLTLEHWEKRFDDALKRIDSDDEELQSQIKSGKMNISRAKSFLQTIENPEKRQSMEHRLIDLLFAGYWLAEISLKKLMPFVAFVGRNPEEAKALKYGEIYNKKHAELIKNIPYNISPAEYKKRCGEANNKAFEYTINLHKKEYKKNISKRSIFRYSRTYWSAVNSSK